MTLSSLQTCQHSSSTSSGYQRSPAQKRRNLHLRYKQSLHCAASWWRHPTLLWWRVRPFVTWLLLCLPEAETFRQTGGGRRGLHQIQQCGLCAKSEWSSRELPVLNLKLFAFTFWETFSQWRSWVRSTLDSRKFYCSAWTLIEFPPSVSCKFVFLFIPVGQKDDRCSEKSGKGGQDWHEAHVLFL